MSTEIYQMSLLYYIDLANKFPVLRMFANREIEKLLYMLRQNVKH